MGKESSEQTCSRNHVTWKEIAAHGLFLLFLIALLFPAIFLQGECTIPGYYLYEHPPWEHYKPPEYVPVHNHPTKEYLFFFAKLNTLSRQFLQNGEWPLWNHLEAGGAPLLANYQSAVFWPFFLFHMVFDMWTAETVKMLLQLWFCGLTAYLCARGLRLSQGPARLFSIALMLGGFCITWFYWPLPAVMGIVPLVFLGAEFLVEQRYKKGFALLLTGATLILLAGHPENAFTASAGIGAYFLIRMAFVRPTAARFMRSAGLALGAWILALGVCAIQIVPFFELVLNSVTFHAGGGHQISQSAGLPPQGLVATIVPRFFGHAADGNFWNDNADNSNTLSYIYIGAATFASIALLAAPGKLSRTRKTQVIALLIPAACGLTMALEACSGILHKVAVWPFWYAAFPLFALPLLGAFGLEHWLSRRRSLKHLLAPGAIVVVVIVAILALFHFHEPVLTMMRLKGYVLFQIALAITAIAAALTMAACHFFPRGSKCVSWGICVVVSLEMLFAARGTLPTTPREHLFPNTPLTEYLQELPHPTRINEQTAGVFPGVFFSYYDIEVLNMWDAISPQRCMWEMMFKTGGDNWDNVRSLSSTRYYLFREGAGPRSDNDSPEFCYLTTLDGIAVYKDPSAFPRAFLVNRIETLPSIDALFERMREPGFDPLQSVLTDFPVETLSANDSQTARGKATILEWGPSTVKISTDSPTEAVLVLLDNYYPGWHALVNGSAAEVFPAYYAFRALRVPAGKSTVEIYYEPLSFKIGMVISVIALLGSALAALIVLGRTSSAGAVWK
ncbi:MAG: YfhO family protein [Candidatus Hydrogenedentota bacterium]